MDVLGFSLGGGAEDVITWWQIVVISDLSMLEDIFQGFGNVILLGFRGLIYGVIGGVDGMFSM